MKTQTETTSISPTELDKAIDFLPCPFCGEMPVLKVAGKTNYWWIGCEIHLGEGGRGCGVSHSSYDRQEAIDKWNNQPAAKRLKEMEKERDEANKRYERLRESVNGMAPRDLERLEYFEKNFFPQQEQLSTLRTDYKQALDALSLIKNGLNQHGHVFAHGVIDDHVDAVLSTPSAIAAMKGEV